LGFPCVVFSSFCFLCFRSGRRVGCEPSINAILRAAIVCSLAIRVVSAAVFDHGSFTWTRPQKGEGNVGPIAMVSTSKWRRHGSEHGEVRGGACGPFPWLWRLSTDGAGEGVGEQTRGMWAIVRSVRMRARCGRASKGRNTRYSMHRAALACFRIQHGGMS
jgi:hypothetical protein